MQKTLIFTALLFIFGATNLFAQTADVGIKPNFAGGEVTAKSADKIVLQTKDGEIQVILDGKTEYKRVPPENPSLRAAVSAALTDITVGDKLLVTGVVTADKKTVPAKTIYLLSKSDIAQKQGKEQEEWKNRGISGQVKSVNPQTKEIIITVRSVMGAKDVTLTAKDSAQFLRYAPNSVSYSEAAKSSFEDVKVGDMLRALGDKTADGGAFKAERVLTGAFQTTAGTITAINAEKGEITLNNVQTKKDITIVLGKNTVAKQFPAEFAQRMAQLQMMQASGIQPGQNGTRPAQSGVPNNSSQAANQTGQGAGMRAGGSIDDMLERFPTITINDLKVGEMVAVSSTKNADQDRVTAIKLLSGVEPFLKTPQMPQGGARRGNSGGVDSGFSIPGLDGVGFP